MKIIPEKDRETSESSRGQQFCDRLFTLERDYTKLSPNDNFKERHLAREKYSRPVMEAFFGWAEKAAPEVLPKSLLGTALRYALGQRVWLEHVLLDGRLELSNNRAERSIKPFVIGRKNWLFNNTPKGADASAVIYSLIETAKENKVNPYEYLTNAFRIAPNLPTGSDVDELLPWNVPI